MIRSAGLGALALVGVQCSPVSDRSNATAQQPTFVEDSSASIDRTQLCSPGEPDGSYPDYPNGFLLAWTPTRFDFGTEPARWVRDVYGEQAVPQVVGLYSEYNKIVAPVFELFRQRDIASLRDSFGDAAALAGRVAEARPRPAKPEISGGPSGAEIEYQAPALALDLAFLILTLDQDYAAFRDRVARLLNGDPAIAETYRFREAGPTQVGKRRIFIGTSAGAVRAMVLFRLLSTDLGAAENAMLFLVEQHASQDTRDYYGPWKASELANHLRTNAASLDQIVFGRMAEVAEVAESGRCSDLAALYVEWLDLASRAAGFTRDAEMARRLRAAIARTRKEVPDGFLASKHKETLDSAETRIASIQGRRS